MSISLLLLHSRPGKQCVRFQLRVRAAMPVEGSKCQNTQEALDVGSKRVCLPDFNTADVYKDVEKYM